jgi:hypothetical protein
MSTTQIFIAIKEILLTLEVKVEIYRKGVSKY